MVRAWLLVLVSSHVGVTVGAPGADGRTYSSEGEVGQFGGAAETARDCVVSCRDNRSLVEVETDRVGTMVGAGSGGVGDGALESVGGEGSILVVADGLELGDGGVEMLPANC